MQSKNIETLIHWKDISEDISVAHFSSSTKNQQIYLKKFKAKISKSSPVTIFLFHDLTSYHGRFLNLVYWFKKNHPDISFVMMDFLGHGLSSGTRGHISHFSELVEDVASVFKMLDKNPEEKWITLGHGVGGLALLELLNHYDGPEKNRIDKVILSNFFLNFPSRMLHYQDKFINSFPELSSLIKTYRPIEIYLAEEILSSQKEQTAYLEDPLIIKNPTLKTFKIINQKVKNIPQDSYFLDKPTLLLKSTSPYILVKEMDSFGKGLKKGLLSEKKYLNLKHDLYNEIESEGVFNDIAEWVLK
jgi:alpha-beta hydrolase superfamily lysophospholipase